MRRYEDPELCRFLRTKAMYVGEERDVVAEENQHTAVFWCLKTMECIGPDDGLTSDERCRANRPCFETGPPV